MLSLCEGLHLSSCNVVNKAPMSPTESDSMRMITLRLKLNPNASQGETLLSCSECSHCVMNKLSFFLLLHFLRSPGCFIWAWSPPLHCLRKIDLRLKCDKSPH